MKVLYAAFIIVVTSDAAIAVQGQTPWLTWDPVTTDGQVTIRGNVYVPENAHRSWSILRAANASCDVFRFEVRAADEWAEDAKSGENKERSELDGYKTRWGSKISIWGAYSFLIEPGPAYRSDWTAIAQMHGSSVRPFHIHFNNDIFAVHTEHLASAGAVENVRYTGKVARNIWHSVVFHLVQSSGDDGVLEFWLDGDKIVSYLGPIGADGNRAYWKFGAYRGYGPIATSFAIEYGNMEIGTADLSSRISHYLPIK